MEYIGIGNALLSVMTGDDSKPWLIAICLIVSIVVMLFLFLLGRGNDSDQDK